MPMSIKPEGERSSTYRRRWELADAVTRMVAHWFQVEEESRFPDAVAHGYFRSELCCGPDVVRPFWVTRETFVDADFVRRSQRLLDRAEGGASQTSGIDDEGVLKKRYSSDRKSVV